MEGRGGGFGKRDSRLCQVSSSLLCATQGPPPRGAILQLHVTLQFLQLVQLHAPPLKPPPPVREEDWGPGNGAPPVCPFEVSEGPSCSKPKRRPLSPGCGAGAPPTHCRGLDPVRFWETVKAHAPEF